MGVTLTAASLLSYPLRRCVFRARVGECARALTFTHILGMAFDAEKWAKEFKMEQAKKQDRADEKEQLRKIKEDRQAREQEARRLADEESRRVENLAQVRVHASDTFVDLLVALLS